MFSLYGESPRVMGLQAGQITSCIKLLQGKLYLCTLKRPNTHIHTHKHTLPILYMSAHVGKNIYCFLQFTQQTTNKSLQEFIFLVVYQKVNCLISSRYFLKYTFSQIFPENLICNRGRYKPIQMLFCSSLFYNIKGLILIMMNEKTTRLNLYVCLHIGTCYMIKNGIYYIT